MRKGGEAYCDVNALGCYKRLPSRQMLRLKWEKTGRMIDACPNCFGKVNADELRKLDVTKKHNAITGLDKLDIKSGLERWAKRVKNNM